MAALIGMVSWSMNPNTTSLYHRPGNNTVHCPESLMCLDDNCFMPTADNWLVPVYLYIPRTAYNTSIKLPM